MDLFGAYYINKIYLIELIPLNLLTDVLYTGCFASKPLHGIYKNNITHSVSAWFL